MKTKMRGFVALLMAAMIMAGDDSDAQRGKEGYLL